MDIEAHAWWSLDDLIPLTVQDVGSFVAAIALFSLVSSVLRQFWCILWPFLSHFRVYIVMFQWLIVTFCVYSENCTEIFLKTLKFQIHEFWHPKGSSNSNFVINRHYNNLQNFEAKNIFFTYLIHVSLFDKDVFLESSLIISFSINSRYISYISLIRANNETRDCT